MNHTSDTSEDLKAVDRLVGEAADWLVDLQEADGHLVFELEADATIPAEYILLNHFLGEPNDKLERKIAVYLRRIQNDEGGWPLFHEGDTDISASVKAYFALKIVGDDPEAPHMVKARQLILGMGGAAKSNVFTRIMLAQFEQIPWRGIPFIPIEVILLPEWFPFHMDKVSYWSRTVMMPLLVLYALHAKARHPRKVHIRELFVTPPEKEKRYNVNPTGHWVGEALLVADKYARRMSFLIPKSWKRKAIDKAMTFIRERINGENGLGAIFPAMANSVMAMDALGYQRDHPDYVVARKSIDNLLVCKETETYCQPCVSPVWDTSLAAHALMEAGRDEAAHAALDWLQGRQVLHVNGDWTARRPDVRPGGWAFQYWNDYYPDVDDTAVVGMALDRQGDPKYIENIDRAVEWIVGMQSSNGGWGAFDAENEHYFLNHIPFADHGALLDPPTEDVTARCLGFLAQVGYGKDHPAVQAALDYLYREQLDDGSWFGRWGSNYIYGTWSVLNALNGVGEDMDSEAVRRAVDWLKSRQQADGGWGESCSSYYDAREAEDSVPTPSHTSWALLGLMAAGEVNSEAVRRGIRWLSQAPRDGGKWHEELYNAPGFPRVFYLHYHGYSAYFPLWALARYRNLVSGNAHRPLYGM
ncbi:squalene--hopene cyclase [Magnetospira sp. QH-2]|uniref:squalene--hopene cyclase n=1 Tax=Magnetospira sp. (strain QH-2) TaxID=1288970 RepID=UPI0003E81604|nr:squalene--hopene cyclase [Magnetospira sp. QH-2]CCQ73410.1 Squalene--hopene cyclase [Magnetospira sp. QH-2]